MGIDSKLPKLPTICCDVCPLVPWLSRRPLPPPPPISFKSTKSISSSAGSLTRITLSQTHLDPLLHLPRRVSRYNVPRHTPRDPRRVQTSQVRRFPHAFALEYLLNVHSVFEVDPEWQRKFSIVWASCVAAAVLYSLPHLLRSIKNGRAYEDFFGVTERWQTLPPRSTTSISGRAPTVPNTRRSGGVKRAAETVLGVIASFALWSIPGLGLNLGQREFSQSIHCIGAPWNLR